MRLAKLWRHVLNVASRPHPDPFFVLGNQKSGTTAIAALLSRATGLAATLDIQDFTVHEQDALHAGQLSMQAFSEKHAHAFSKRIIKEPALSFLCRPLIGAFPRARGVWIVRDPRHNIRSILNRVGLPGDLGVSPDLSGIPEAWRRILDNEWLGLESTNYIGSMARRWNLAVETYERHADRFVLVRYEDFVRDKATTIESLAATLGLSSVYDIRDMVDVQFQPKGSRSVPLLDFFGKKNLGIIHEVCGTKAEILGYKDIP